MFGVVKCECISGVVEQVFEHLVIVKKHHCIVDNHVSSFANVLKLQVMTCLNSYCIQS